MNIEEYNKESLRKLVRSLQKENNMLKSQLQRAGIPFEVDDVFTEKIIKKEEYDLDQGSRIQSHFIDDKQVKLFFSMFWGREDVYAKRAKNGNYYPQCINRWNELCPAFNGGKIKCDECENKNWSRLSVEIVKRHLLGYKEDGTDVIGIYPLLADATCRFIVFDFDNHAKDAEKTDFANTDEEWHEEVDALRLMCIKNGIVPLVERSRSGKGAHVWIFFKNKISASIARNFGYMLLNKGAASINLKTFHFYDRMYPSQDTSSGIGNLIALPLQGQALKNGNSAFVDENWNAYPNQWDILLNQTPKYSLNEIQNYIIKWNSELALSMGQLSFNQIDKRPKPWKRNDKFNPMDVSGKIHITMGDGIYVDTLNLTPHIQNQIRSMAAFDNPIFYKNKRLGYSNYYNYSTVYMGKDVNGYIKLPRGLRDKIEEKCNESGIPYDIEDIRSKGRPLRISFIGKLKAEQNEAIETLLHYDNGILSAATAFGKTVVCSYLIAKRKVSTLILIQNKDLLNQWVEELKTFLDIDEELPKYLTKGGKEKIRESVIGILHGGKNTLSGIVDIAMIQSLAGKSEYEELLKSYGMVIMDECHHGASTSSIDVLQRVNARYVYGVSATPKRSDELEKIIYMLIGPIRHSFTAKQRAEQQNIGHYIYPRYTRLIGNHESRNDINVAYALVSSNQARNNMIIEDVKECINKGRTPLILTRQKEQAKLLFENLHNFADHVCLLYGDNTDKENQRIINELQNTSKEESLILVATAQKIGEGFNFPRLDTLMLAAPVSDPSKVEQYVGRLNRDYEGKKEVIVYDYVDSHIRFFDNMYTSRLRTYKKIGFDVVTDVVLDKQKVNAIYDSMNYVDVFERDIVEANKNIVISSSQLEWDKINRFILLVKARQEAGVEVTIITMDADNIVMGSADNHLIAIKMLTDAGIYVETKEEINERFAVIDDELVWHGGANLLGKPDAWDNLIRVKNHDIAAELLEMLLQ